jgi:hypothetical protein
LKKQVTGSACFMAIHIKPAVNPDINENCICLFSGNGLRYNIDSLTCCLLPEENRHDVHSTIPDIRPAKILGGRHADRIPLLDEALFLRL